LNKKGLVGVVKFSIIAVALIIIFLFIINFVLPTVASDTSETKDMWFRVTDSSGLPVANDSVSIFTSDAVDSTYNLESSVITDTNGFVKVSTYSNKFAYFVFEKKSYSVRWPEEITTNAVLSPYFFVINTNDIVSSEAEPISISGLDVIPQIWSDKSNYNLGETAVIYGIGFDYDSIQLNISYPDGYVVDNVSVDSEGSFTYNYVLSVMSEKFEVNAIDSGNILASTTFDDDNETTLKIFSTADSWVNINQPTTNYGSDNLLHVTNTSSILRRESYLKFGLGAIPSNKIITAATLHMYVTSDGQSASRTLGTYFVSNDSWTESGINWNNKPAINGLINSTSVGSGVWAVWNVLGNVQTEYNGDKIISMALTFSQQDVLNYKYFYSKEYYCSEKRPYLEIKYVNITGCDSYTDNSSCAADTNCKWCSQCEEPDWSTYGKSKVNAWHQDKCVNSTVDCGYDCKVGFCGATCENNTQCQCPLSGCNGTSYYSYPAYGTCPDCPCTCHVGTGEGEPCAPNITLNDPRCITPKHSECSGGQCIQVEGQGDNKCSIDSDCYHSECNFGSQQCIVVNAWPDVADSCTSNEQCTACLPDIVVDKKVSPSSFSICQNTTITLNVTGVGCPQTIHFPVDAMIVFDRTGSMDDDCPGGVEANTSPCKIHDAKVAAKFFVGLLNPSSDRSGLVSFNNTATLNQGLTYNQTAVQSAIDTLKALGQTAIGGGISAANNELTSHGRNNSVWIEILVTDGNENLGSDPVSRANEAKAAGIVIYTIGIGADADQSLLQQIATITGGKFYYAPNGTVLQQIYQNISQEILNIAGKNVVVKDVIPSYANYLDALTSTPTDNCSYNSSVKTITCNLGNMLIGQNYLITFKLSFNQSGNLLANVYPDSNVTFTDYNNSQRTRVFPQTNVSVIVCDDGIYCNGVETCSAGSCQSGTNINCSYLNNQCNSGICSETNKRCEYNPFPTGTQCNDNIYCDGNDICNATGASGLVPGICVNAGPSVNCSTNNLVGITTCDWNPDDYHPTWDFRDLFNSNCIEDGNNTGHCTSGNNTITHTCSVANCTAECDATHSCQNKCIGNIRYLNGTCDSRPTACNCSYTTENCDLQDNCYAYGTGCEDRDYSCAPNNCTYNYTNRNTDYNDSFVNYCSADTIRKHKQFHDFYCGGTCSDHTSWLDDQLFQNCNLQDGWYNTSTTQWINETQCTERQQVQQEYRDYTCSPTPTVNCTFNVSNTQWINSSQIRNKPNGTACDDGQYCTVNDVCTNGQCGGSSRDCSGNNLTEIAQCNNNPDSNPFTFDYAQGFTSTCDEIHDKCTNSTYNYTHACADANATDGGPTIPAQDGVRTCTAECDSFGAECQNKCVGQVWYHVGSCNLNSCSCNYTTYNCDNDDRCYSYGSGCEDRDYFCQAVGCNYTYSNRNTDYYGNFTNYCSANTIRTNRTFHDFGCDGTCLDHTSQVNDSLIEDCSLQNGWNDTGTTRWINETQCTERQQKEQKYRNYTCSNANCTYTNTSTQWVNTTNTRPKPIETPCDDNNYCTVNDHCDGQGSCIGGGTYNCSGSNLQEISTCGWDPDARSSTFDWRLAFTSECVNTGNNTGHCTSGNETIDHFCADADNQDSGPQVPVGNGIRTCNAQCDGFGAECLPYIGGDDYCYINGQCNSNPSACTCSWTKDAYCPLAGTVIDGYCYWGTRSCDNTTGCTLNKTLMGCNDECDPETGPKDTIGPTTTQLGLQRKCNIINVTANVSNCNKINEAEYFFDVCPDKSIRGTSMSALDGSFDSPSEIVYVYNIDLANTLPILLDGRHNIYVRGKDEFGNWGNCSSVGFDLDIYPPYTSDQHVESQVACGGNTSITAGGNVTITALVCEPLFLNQSFVCGAEFFLDNFNTSNGEGYPMQPVDGNWADDYCEWVTGTLNTSQLSEGTHWIKVHAVDCVCNWGKIDFLAPVWFIKDTTPPITSKTLIPYDNMKVDCYGSEQQDSNVYDKAPNGLTNGCGYVKSGTQIVLSAQDQDTPDHEISNHVQIHWIVWYKVNPGSPWTSDQSGIGGDGQNVTITLNKDSYHLIEYWSQDSCTNEEKPHHFELDIVDNKAPTITKIEGDPKVSCDPADPSGCVYFVKDHVTTIDLYCSDQQPHPVDHVNLWYRILMDGNVIQDWTDRIAAEVHKQINFTEDSIHTLQYYCEDELGNSNGTRDNPHQQIYRVDSTSPNTTKIYGAPLVTTDGGYPKWINSSTSITLTAVDGGDVCHVGVNKTYWRNTILASNDACENSSICQQTQGSGNWNEYVAPFNKPEQSCHLIEYYSVDKLGNAEDVKKQCVYVENTPPVSTKTVGTPNKNVTANCSSLGQGTYTDGCYFITQNTLINLTCTDGQPHPVDNVKIWYKIDWKNQSSDSWTEGSLIQDSNFVSFSYNKDSFHRLTWYCVDALGNKEQDHTELDIVDTEPPVSQKSMGDPKHVCTPEEQALYYPQMSDPTNGCYFINQSTPITLSCSDQQPHPVDNVKIYYRDYLFDSTAPQFTEVNGDNVTITKNEDSRHILEWYCTDELGNKENNHVEYDIVDTQYPNSTIETIGPEYWYEEKHFIDGVTQINLTCSDGDPHPVNHVKIYYRYYVDESLTQDWIEYTSPFSFPQESHHELEYFCNDTLGNEEPIHTAEFYVDHTKPVTTKTYDEPYYSNDGEEWINSSTPITLTASDGTEEHASGVNKTYYRITLVDKKYCSGEWDCQGAQGTSGFTEYSDPFTIPDESCHLIEFYSVDHVNKTETVKKQCDYVENTPPVTTKTVGDPKHNCTEEELNFFNGRLLGQEYTFTDGCYYINQSTHITLNCSEVGPHPTSNVTLRWRWKLDDEEWSPWNNEIGIEELTFNEDTFHELEWYCVDALGNEEQHHHELDIVDTQYPNVTKTVGEPKVSCGENCWYITNDTEISLDCNDGEPHPVDHVSTYYRYYLDGVLTQDWTLYTEPFKLLEYSNHTVQYYCEDILGNTGPIFTEMDKVDNIPPIITPDPCYDIQTGKEITIYANITDDKVGVDDSTTKAYIEYPNGTIEEILLVYNSTTGRYEAQWTAPDLEGVYYVDFAASDLLGNSAYLDNGKFIVIDNTPPEISSVFTGRTWIGLGDKFYVDAEVDDNSLHWERICKPIKCFVRVVDNKGKQGYLEGQLQMEEGVPKCSGFVTVNDTFYEAQAQLWVDAIDGAGNNASERKLEPIGIDNSKMISLTGVNESEWYREDQWINNVVATVDSSKFGEVTSCSIDISGVSPENNLTHSGNQCIGSIRIPHLSDGEKKLKVTATNINGKIVSDSVNIRIDNTPPEKVILSPINETYISTDIPIIINATDPLSGVKNVSFRVVKDAWLLFNLIPIPGTAYDSGWISTTFNGTTWNYTFNASDLTPGETYYFGSMVCDNVGNCKDPPSYTIVIVDKTPPTWPSPAALSVTFSPYDKDGEVILGWPEASDKNGVDHYDISINGILKKATAGTAYTFLNLSDGFYSFSVAPVDKVGNRGAELTGSTTVMRSCAVDVTCTQPASNGSSSSSGTSYSGGTTQPYITTGTTQPSITTGTTQPQQTEQTTVQECIPYWSCGSWSVCKDGKQTRSCTDKNECIKTAKNETQDCTIVVPTIVPTTGLFEFINSPIGYAAIGSIIIFVILAILGKKKFF
jgi:hypothetical protein